MRQASFLRAAAGMYAATSMIKDSEVREQINSRPQAFCCSTLCMLYKPHRDAASLEIAQHVLELLGAVDLPSTRIYISTYIYPLS